MRLWPDSLFGRLMLTLVGVLLAAQVAGIAIHFSDRGQMLHNTLGRQGAERIAALVRLLDSLPPQSRELVVRSFDRPPLSITLNRQAPAAAAQESTTAAMFSRMLRHDLGNARPLRVVAIDRTPDAEPPARPEAANRPAPHPAMGHMRRHAMRPWQADFGFQVSVQLEDGVWVHFQRQLPRDAFIWPRKLLASLGIMLISVVAVSLFVVRRLTRPMATLADAAETLGRDINAPALDESGPREVREAARAFNTMQERIRRYMEDHARTLAAISHDLRTPLTRLRLRTEMLDDEASREKFAADLTEMEQMVGGALAFLRGEGSDESLQPLDLDALLESLIADLPGGEGRITIAGRADAPVPARPLALKRCLTNVLENALRYAGGAQVQIERDRAEVRLRIRDQGPGIAVEHLERIFDPFYRVETSRNRETGGSGLGLGIARNIARGHGGDLSLSNRPEGGLEVLLRLPV